MARQTWLSLFIGGAFVGTLALLGHHDMATPVPFWLLLPGIVAGAFVPGADLNPEGDEHPWGALATIVVYAVNVACYGGLANLLLRLGRSIVLSQKRRTA